jgi:hypothetical protein
MHRLTAIFGGDGEIVDDPAQIEPALCREFEAEKSRISFIYGCAIGA